jgi:hypothetical protein
MISQHSLLAETILSGYFGRQRVDDVIGTGLMGPRWACKIDSGLRCWVFVKRGVAIIPDNLCRQQLAEARMGHSLGVGGSGRPEGPTTRSFSRRAMA